MIKLSKALYAPALDLMVVNLSVAYAISIMNNINAAPIPEPNTTA